MSEAFGGGYGRHVNIDPTAGTTLVRMVMCPRCGCAKGRVSKARPGLCRDCSDVVGPEYRSAWAA